MYVKIIPNHRKRLCKNCIFSFSTIDEFIQNCSTANRTYKSVKRNTPCIFPFKLNGAIYHRCFKSYDDPSGSEKWCSTLNDNSGESIRATRGRCESACQNFEPTFTCANGKSIKKYWKCDGDFDCGDNDQSDEEGCPGKNFNYVLFLRI